MSFKHQLACTQLRTSPDNGDSRQKSRGSWETASGSNHTWATAPAGAGRRPLPPSLLHHRGCSWLPGSPGAPSLPPSGCSRPSRAAPPRQEEAGGQRIGFPGAKEAWASKPRARLLPGSKTKGLVRSWGPDHPVSTHSTDGGSDLITSYMSHAT